MKRQKPKLKSQKEKKVGRQKTEVGRKDKRQKKENIKAIGNRQKLYSG